MDILWHSLRSLALTLALFTSVITFLILCTLPSAYSASEQSFITEESFTSSSQEKNSDEDSTTQNDSSYAFFTKHKDSMGRLAHSTSVQIVVLGDIGRSPRMQYHALSLAAHGARVSLVGYTGAEIHPDIQRSGLINVVPIAPWPARLQSSNKLLFLLLAPFKVLWQVGSLYYVLAYRCAQPSRWMLVQNPPSIPTLGVALLVCYFRNTRLVIDWHNFGYTILALRLGASHPLVRVSEWYEGFFGSRASAHFAVTAAMTRVLREKWNITAVPLHDRPADIYQPLTAAQRADVLRRLPGTEAYAADIEAGRCRLVVSSTSWTADEDFSVLLDALVQYSSAVATTLTATASSPDPASSTQLLHQTLPNIIAIITGRGPQRDHYLAQISQLTHEQRLQHVLVTTAWLSPQDYAGLLGAADLGVSLHTSSSGVDLPMKVVDMFGTGLPVAGWGAFEAWPELVREGENGRGFASAAQLQQILVELFGRDKRSDTPARTEPPKDLHASHPGDNSTLRHLRRGAHSECSRRWNDEWRPVAGRVFQLPGIG